MFICNLGNKSKKCGTIINVYIVECNRENMDKLNAGWQPTDEDFWVMTLAEVQSSVRVHPFNGLVSMFPKVVYINLNLVNRCTAWIVNVLMMRAWKDIEELKIELMNYIDNSSASFNEAIYITISEELKFELEAIVNRKTFVNSMTLKIVEMSTLN